MDINEGVVADADISKAIAQQSLGPLIPRFDLYPVQIRGCPVTSSDRMQFPLEVTYDYDAINVDVLFGQPALPGLERWAPLLPPMVKGLSLGEGGTPLLPLAVEGEVQVYLKDESRNPTASHKDRLNLCTVSAAIHSGSRGVVVSSSGNHGVSAAAYAARAGLACLVLTVPEAAPAYLAMLEAFGAHAVAVPTDARWPLMSEVVDRAGFHPCSNLTPFHTGHPFGPEGYKTIAYELFLQLGNKFPRAVLVPTGYGELLFGICKGFIELMRFGLGNELPRFYPVEPQARGPLWQAVEKGVEATSVPAAPTDLLSIACTVSGYRGVWVLEESEGRPLLVSDEDAREWQKRLGRNGHWVELSAAAGFAGLCQLTREEKQDGPIVIVSTSAGYKDKAAVFHPTEIEPSYEALAGYLAGAGVALA